MNEEATKGCNRCVHRREAMVFEECRHPDSEYIADGKHGFHTIGHMRRYNCGPSMRLFIERKR